MDTLNKKNSELLDEFDFDEEEIEYTKGTNIKTGYPKPEHRYRFFYRSPNDELEDMYFYFINFLKNELGYPKIEKITDVFSASEHSTQFGDSMQRVGIQQQKAMELLRTIGQLVKEIFQHVRDLRMADERLKYYEDSKDKPSADTALKGIWADTVDSNEKTGQSIFSLANKLDYSTLPTFFFNIYIKNRDEIDEKVESIDIDNKQVKSLLKRKFYQFLNWKEESEKQLKTFRKFQLNYLKQQYNTIKLYISWLKPYITNVKNLQSDTSLNQKAEMIKSFETSSIELETMGVKKDNGLYNCLHLTFDYLTKPNVVTNQRHQKFMTHSGEVEVNIRGYVWTEEEYKKFKEMKEKEELELIGSIDESIKEAVDSLGDELMAYLEEANKYDNEENDEENKKNSNDKKNKKQFNNPLKPFTDVFSGFYQLGKIMFPFNLSSGSSDGSDNEDSESNNSDEDKDKSKNIKTIKKHTFITYNVYKKIHGFESW